MLSAAGVSRQLPPSAYGCRRHPTSTAGCPRRAGVANIHGLEETDLEHYGRLEAMMAEIDGFSSNRLRSRWGASSRGIDNNAAAWTHDGSAIADLLHPRARRSAARRNRNRVAREARPRFSLLACEMRRAREKARQRARGTGASIGNRGRLPGLEQSPPRRDLLRSFRQRLGGAYLQPAPAP